MRLAIKRFEHNHIYLHDSVTGHSQQPRPLLGELDRGERKRFAVGEKKQPIEFQDPSDSIVSFNPLLESRLRNNPCNKRNRILHAFLIKNGTHALVEKMVPRPMKVHRFPFFSQNELEFPEGFRVKFLDAAVLVDYEAEGGELA